MSSLPQPRAAHVPAPRRAVAVLAVGVLAASLAACGDHSVAPAYLVAASAPSQTGVLDDGRVDMLEPAGRYVQAVAGAE